MLPKPDFQPIGSPSDERREQIAPHGQSKVLILDDDLDCLDAYAELVGNLGYDCLSSADPIDALRKMENDPTIGVVVTDLAMPSMNGITFLEEVGARFALLRPVVPIVITGMGTLDDAVQAMNSNAVDFLAKPVTQEALARALRRAFLRRSQLVSSELLAAFAKTQAKNDGDSGKSGQDAGGGASDQQLIRLVRATIRFRQRRKEYLNSELFADPAWDILLELTLAKLQGEPVPVSSACAAADVPFTTAYRYVGSLVDLGMVRRWKDPSDQRRVLLELEDATLEAMADFLRSSGMFDRS